MSDKQIKQIKVKTHSFIRLYIGTEIQIMFRSASFSFLLLLNLDNYFSIKTVQHYIFLLILYRSSCYGMKADNSTPGISYKIEPQIRLTQKLIILNSLVSSAIDRLYSFGFLNVLNSSINKDCQNVLLVL